MAKITYTNKVDGSSEVNASDMNQIKNSVNALYDALFTSGIIGSGVIKDSALPGFELSGDQFDGSGIPDSGDPIKLSDAFIATLGGSSGTTPVAPTVIADDGADTLKFTHTLGTSELIVSVNNGSYIPIADVEGWDSEDELINVGDIARAAGYYKCRTKADPTEDRNAGSIASSPAFNVEGVGLANLNFSRFEFDAKVDPEQDNSVLFKDPASVGFGVGFSDKKAVAGSSVKFVAQGKTGIPGIGKLILDTTNGTISNPDNPPYWIDFRDNVAQRKILSKGFATNIDVPGGIASELIMIGFDLHDNTLDFVYSYDGGETWEISQTVEDVTVDLYAKVAPEENEYGEKNIYNIKHSGLVAV